MIKLKHISSLFSKAIGDTIYAVATNHSKPSPINIVRISGPQSYKCLRMISKTNNLSQYSKTQFFRKHKILPRYAHNATLYTQQQKSPIDKCLIIYFPEGKSYNGEDIFELHLHGSPAVLKLTIAELKGLGFRLADPGEFTKRAFVNNKMNLIEIEGLNELIHSQNEFSRKIAMCHIMGETSEYLQKIKKQLVSCLAACEAFIDFQQDELDVKADLFDKTKLRTIKISEEIKEILSRKKQIQTMSNGINLVIVGKPNAGKSTIMNKMVKEEVAIVSDEPGTTRDIIKTSFEYKGMQFNLSDTAGIRQTQQKVEKQGIRRALEKVKYSHMNLLIIDGIQEKIIQKQNEVEVQMSNFANEDLFMSEKTIIILNKTDLLDEKLKSRKIYVNLNGNIRTVDISISALHQNIQQIMQYLLNKVIVPIFSANKFTIFNNTKIKYFQVDKDIFNAYNNVYTIWKSTSVLKKQILHQKS